MATLTRPAPQNGRAHEHSRNVARLAEHEALASAQRWFSREREWIDSHHLQICRIGAPTFFEQQRAEWLAAKLESLGWAAHRDRAGNVVARFRDASAEPRFVISAHLDTVFAPGKPEQIAQSPDGRFTGPGVSDNGSGLAALVALARLLGETRELQELASSLLLVANVGEEGEGNLSGMRYLCSHTPEIEHVKGFIVLDGPALDHITMQALASRRFEISFNGPGGHSWNDHGVPNPVHALAELVSAFLHSASEHVPADRADRCSWNFGVLEGGRSVNSIPTHARAKLDLRSEDGAVLDELSSLLSAAAGKALERENRNARGGRLTAKVKDLGSRPGGRVCDNAPLLEAIQSVDAHLHIRSRLNCASTDANIPLSLGFEAISIGTGGTGGGAHTEQEWYRPERRELGLWRILLLLAALNSEALGAARDHIDHGEPVRA